MFCRVLWLVLVDYFLMSVEVVEELSDLYCPQHCRTLQLVITLYWLSIYPTWDQLSVFWRRDVKTLQDDVWHALMILYNNLDEV
jgi:hypothetical protein